MVGCGRCWDEAGYGRLKWAVVGGGMWWREVAVFGGREWAKVSVAVGGVRN